MQEYREIDDPHLKISEEDLCITENHIRLVGLGVTQEMREAVQDIDTQTAIDNVYNAVMSLANKLGKVQYIQITGDIENGGSSMLALDVSQVMRKPKR